MKSAGFILIVESPLVRMGIASLLSKFPGIRIIREFGDPDEFLKFMSRNRHDYLIICERLLSRASDLFESDPGLLDRTLLLRNSEGPETNGGIGTVLYYSDTREELAHKIRRLLNSGPGHITPDDNRSLTKRERTIARLVSLGYTNKQIAAELFLSTHTVITHRKNISAKLGIRSVSALTVYAIVNNIITMEEVASNPRS